MRKERLRKGWTVRDVATRSAELGMPVSFSNYSRCERGTIRPLPRTVLAIARALDLEVDDLLLSENGRGAA